MQPNLLEEKKLWEKGFRHVVCVDEVGRGPLAGPVIAAAAMIKISNSQFSISNKFSISNFKFLKNLKDSKQLSPKKREEFYKILTRHHQILWAVAGVSPKIIDKINIFEATKLVMEKAVEKLNKKIKKAYKDKKISKPKIINYYRGRDNSRQNFDIDFLILDGKMRIALPIPQKSIVKADEKVFSCAAASIIAKVTRDRIMVRYHKKYPQYRFDLHKGYPTKLHRALLKRYGPLPTHRKSFKLFDI